MTPPPSGASARAPQAQPVLVRLLGAVEAVGNRLPDPTALFVLFLAIVLASSWLLSRFTWSLVDPRSGAPLQIVNLLEGKELAGLLSGMVGAFTAFPPLGVVLVALLGIGVAEHAGLVNAGVRAALALTPRQLLTPATVLVALLSHTAADAGLILLPLAGVIFRASGRHPVAGIAAALAGWAGGFSANFIPSGIDPLLAGLTQAGAQLVSPAYVVNPLCNWFFASASCLPIVLVAWFVTDRIVEPRLASLPVVEQAEGAAGSAGAAGSKDEPATGPLDARERRALAAALASIAIGLALLALWALPGGSALRGAGGSLTAPDAALMRSIVPLIFILSLVPGVVYGTIAKTFRSHRDIVTGMTRAMAGMGYYLVLAFCAAQFLAAFARSNLGVLVALGGADGLKQLALPGPVTIVGIILLTNAVNVLMASSSAKWAVLAPVLVPMLMALGLSPELTQAAYRVGDSTSNILTPLNPYVPLTVLFIRRWSPSAGLGTLLAQMIPYWAGFTLVWIPLLLSWWALGLPLGLNAPYLYPAP
ncbi:MAG: AbgT family transporter [Acidobacteria bacterium]|nr:AbgT family transporter [Acidobacteriota bacterium]